MNAQHAVWARPIIVRGTLFSPDGQEIFIATADNTIMCIDLSTKKELWKRNISKGQRVVDVYFVSPSILACGLYRSPFDVALSGDFLINFFDRNTGRMLSEFEYSKNVSEYESKFLTLKNNFLYATVNENKLLCLDISPVLILSFLINPMFP